MITQEMAGTPVHSALAAIHNFPSIDILDESDALLDSRVQLIYATGDKEPLPDCVIRCENVQELLHALDTDAGVAEVLSDLNVAEVVQQDGRWGGMRSIRLVQGVLGL
jgi:hypothetical protein